MKNKTSKLARMENNRFSILTDNLNQCYYCNALKNDLHEIFGGCRRKVSIKYGLVVPVCRTCHMIIENDEEVKLKMKQNAEKLWIKYYNKTIEDFIKEFGKNYI